MNLRIKTIRSVLGMTGVPVLVLALGFLVCGTPARASKPCRDRDGNCDKDRDPKRVPEPSSVIQLGAGLLVLGTGAMLGGKRLFAVKS